ncbi:MAG: RsiV family protein [Acinetobacter populi]|jgi:hypothetical protein|uniref:RsiV family protein n=1 Tax=Acinetobacter populi TaxID=1582270 RepID=UPI002353E7CC|nr:RsiV family protein [Acinetobacter populi]MCH4246327.1 RsiV family protein [Acinetobacter populi]
MIKNYIFTLAVAILVGGLTACAPKKSPVNDSGQDTNTKSEVIPQPEQLPAKQQSDDIPAVWAKSYRVSQQELCEAATEDREAACTTYDIQSIKTNVDWINQYYHAQLQDSALGIATEKNVDKSQGEFRQYYDGSMVSFVGQRYQLVTFSRFHNVYLGGAHNVFSVQYDVFDLKVRKKLALNDVLHKNSQSKILALLKQNNAHELKEYGTDLDSLKLSENFYFAENGLVFVYALYEIAPFVYGMPELHVPYEDLKELLKTEYMPSLPDMTLSENFS